MPRVHEKIGPPMEIYGDGDSEAHFWVMEDCIFVARVGRVATVDTAKRCNAICQRLVDRGQRVHMFNDWLDIETHEPESRQVLTRWAIENRNNLRRSFYLAKSSLLLMGLQVASMIFAKGLMATSDEQVFFDAFDAIVKKVRSEQTG
jgi:hypothetical protein